MRKKMFAYCTYEDRNGGLIGVKLLLLSYARHGGGYDFHVYLREKDESFEKWCRTNAPFASVFYCTHDQQGWSVKPWIMMNTFSRGYARVGWLDADLIINGNLDSILSDQLKDILVVSSATGVADGGYLPLRATHWGLQVARRLSFSLNSAVLVAGEKDIPLLRRWEEIMGCEAYRTIQKHDFFLRERGLQSDQDVLEGLLMSSEYADVPVAALQSGRQVANCLGWQGYSFIERLRNMGKGLPLLVHAQGAKPWYRSRTKRGFQSLFLQLTPYNMVATEYESKLDEPILWAHPEQFGWRKYQDWTQFAPNFSLMPLMAIDYAKTLPCRIMTTFRNRLGRLFKS